MDRLELLKRNTSEILTEEELILLLQKENPRAYIGFEPSGLPNLAVLLWTHKLNDLVNAGISLQVLLADWHASLNDKFGGDMDKIKASGLMLEKAMKLCGLSDKVEFIWASDLVSSSDYWAMLLKTAKHSSLKRLIRSLPIMGRTEEDADKDFSKLIYPLMQTVDCFYLDCDLALGGTDQRHAYMLARELADKMNVKKPVILELPLLSSLKGKGRMIVL